MGFLDLEWALAHCISFHLSVWVLRFLLIWSRTFHSSSWLLQVSTPLIKNILLLDGEGKRVAVKYFSDDWPTLNAKLAFEKSVFTKTQKTSARTEGKNFRFQITYLFHASIFRRDLLIFWDVQKAVLCGSMFGTEALKRESCLCFCNVWNLESIVCKVAGSCYCFKLLNQCLDPRRKIQP